MASGSPLGYDTAGRINLIRDELTATGEIVHQTDLGFDALDRIINEVTAPEPVGLLVDSAIMTYDADNRMSSFNGQNTPSDEDGNMLTAPLQGALAALTWDARNRLTSAGGLSYTYDSENRRTSRTSGSTTTTYVHDPNSRLSRLLTSTTGTETTRFVYAGDRLLYQENPNGEISVFHFDTRGSTVAISDAAGTVTDGMSYGPYGEVISTTGNTPTPFRYHGALGVQTDPNGLCQMRARYYSPEIRRFLNADPIGFEGGAN